MFTTFGVFKSIANFVKKNYGNPKNAIHLNMVRMRMCFFFEQRLGKLHSKVCTRSFCKSAKFHR